jgi:OmpA-OmpF porin, OOP family
MNKQPNTSLRHQAWTLATMAAAVAATLASVACSSPMAPMATATATANATASATAPAATAAAMSPVATGKADERITLNQQAYAQQQAAIKALNDSGQHRVASFDLSKAQCWLDVSFHEHSRNDRSNFPSWAYDNSRRITSEMERGISPSPAAATGRNDELDPAKLRADLWDRTAALRGHRGASCAAQRLACAEVELAHASHEQAQFGWRHAKPYVQIAEDLVGEARRLAEQCLPPTPTPRAVAPAPAPVLSGPVVAPVALAAPAPAPAPVAAPAPAPRVTTETLNLGAKVQFAFDKGGLNDMLPGAQGELKELADRLARVYSRIDSLVVTGHTDRLGSAAYNAKLAKTRADSVRAYLVSAGVQAPIDTRFEGSSKPLSTTCAGKPGSSELKACLQQDRRVEVQVTGVKR